MKSRKAQMELMGIAIVVVIISMVLVFALKSVANRKPTEFKEEYSSSELSTNIVKTLLATTAPACYGLTFNELFQNCAEGHGTSPSLTCSDGRNSCQYASQETENILNATLVQLGVDHMFKVIIGDKIETGTTIIDIGECSGDASSRRTRPYPIQTGTSVINILLYICY